MTTEDKIKQLEEDIKTLHRMAIANQAVLETLLTLLQCNQSEDLVDRCIDHLKEKHLQMKENKLPQLPTPFFDRYRNILRDLK